MENPKKAMKQIRSIVKEFLPKFAAGEVIDNCAHFGDVIRDLYDEEDTIRLVIALQDVATAEKAKKERAGQHILNLKNHINDLRELIELQRQDLIALNNRAQSMSTSNKDLYLKIEKLQDEIQKAYIERDAAMILLKNTLND